MANDTTWLDPEEAAYPHGGFTRRGRALIARNEHAPLDLPYGQVRAIRASIPDTWWTIPARMRYRGERVRGFLTLDEDGAYQFQPEARPDLCTVCKAGDGCKWGG
jgi:hypothetical protein